MSAKLAADLGNVSKACRAMGYSGRRNFQTDGAKGLLDKIAGRQATAPNRVTDDVEKVILDHSLAYPCHGAVRVANELALPATYGDAVCSAAGCYAWRRPRPSAPHPASGSDANTRYNCRFYRASGPEPRSRRLVKRLHNTGFQCGSRGSGVEIVRYINKNSRLSITEVLVAKSGSSAITNGRPRPFRPRQNAMEVQMMDVLTTDDSHTGGHS